jgi:hypothetical protein
MSDDRMLNECGGFDGMTVGRGNGCTLRKSDLVSLSTLHIPHDPTLDLAWTTVGVHPNDIRYTVGVTLGFRCAVLSALLLLTFS